MPVLVVVSVDPATSHRANEAIRIALGILAGENQVRIALVGAGARVLAEDVEDLVDGEDIHRHLATFKKLGQGFHVERQRIDGVPGWNPVGVTVTPLDRPGFVRLLGESRRTLVF